MKVYHDPATGNVVAVHRGRAIQFYEMDPTEAVNRANIMHLQLSENRHSRNHCSLIPHDVQEAALNPDEEHLPPEIPTCETTPLRKPPA